MHAFGENINTIWMGSCGEYFQLGAWQKTYWKQSQAEIKSEGTILRV